MQVDNVLDLATTQIWQIAVLAIVVAMVAPHVGKKSSHFAHLLWLVVIIKCITPPIFSSPAGIFSSVQTADSVSELDEARMGAVYLGNESPTAATGDVIAPELIADSPENGVVDASTFKSVVPSFSVDWTRLAVGVWMLGAIVYAAFLSGCWLRFRLALRKGSAPMSHLLAIYRQVLGRDKPQAVPELVVVSEDVGPAATGCLHPRIVLPSRVVEEATSSELHAILAHELSHVRRGDIWIAWVQAIATCVWWFNPIVWFANSQANRWREIACDDESMSRFRISSREYANGLLRVMSTRVRSAAAWTPGMAVGYATQHRLQRIMSGYARPVRTPAWAWAACLAVACVVLPGAAQTVELKDNSVTVVIESTPASEAEDSAANATGSLQLALTGSEVPDPVLEQSVEIQGKLTGPAPVNGTRLEMVRIRGAVATEPVAVNTDAQGRFQFPPQKLRLDRGDRQPVEQVVIRATTSAGVTSWDKWDVRDQGDRIALVKTAQGWLTLNSRAVIDPPPGPPSPVVSQVAMSLPGKHVDLSGRVINESGDPVAGARVAVVAYGGTGANAVVEEWDTASPVVSFPTETPLIALPRKLQLSTRADENGSWSIPGLPDGLRVEMVASTAASHWTSTGLSASAKPIEFQIADVAPTSVVVVDDASGKPAANIQITAAYAKGNSNQTFRAERRTDAGGKAVLQLPRGEVTFTMMPGRVNAMRCYPTTVKVAIDGKNSPVALRMHSGAELTFRVVDDATGNPVPYLPVRPTHDSQLDYNTIRREIKDGVTTLRMRTGLARFTIPAAAHKGYTVANPIEEPVKIAPGIATEYTFRLKKMQKYRPPVDEDDTAVFSLAHQRAAAALRELGAIVRSNGNRQEGHCGVLLTQFWTGSPSDLKWLADLEHLKSINCVKYPAPSGFARERALPAPLVTDEWVPHFAAADDLVYLQVSRSDITDAGMLPLKSCKKLQTIVALDSQIVGKSLDILAALPLQYLHVESDRFDLSDVDLSPCETLSMVHFQSSTGVAVVPPRAGASVMQANVSPANAESLKRLETYPGLSYLLLAGPELTDKAMVGSGIWRRVEMVSLENCPVTATGLASLADTKITTLHLKGETFTDAVVPSLQKMEQLKLLRLMDTSVSAVGVDRLRNGNSNLEVHAR